MKVAVTYCFPIAQGRTYFPLGVRFAQTYQSFESGAQHDFYIIANGGQPAANQLQPFADIPHKLFVHDNTGWDIGAYQRAAERIPCDLLVCLGAHAHFHRDGWLKKMVDAWVNYGPGLYGCAAYMTPIQHVRTTLFWCPPLLLQSYPEYIGSSRNSRYQFEHGPHSFTRHVLEAGFPAMMITFRGDFPFPKWGTDAYNPISEGSPSPDEILVRDQFIHG